MYWKPAPTRLCANYEQQKNDVDGGDTRRPSYPVRPAALLALTRFTQKVVNRGEKRRSPGPMAARLPGPRAARRSRCSTSARTRAGTVVGERVRNGRSTRSGWRARASRPGFWSRDAGGSIAWSQHSSGTPNEGSPTEFTTWRSRPRRGGCRRAGGCPPSPRSPPAGPARGQAIALKLGDRAVGQLERPPSHPVRLDVVGMHSRRSRWSH